MSPILSPIRVYFKPKIGLEPNFGLDFLPEPSMLFKKDQIIKYRGLNALESHDTLQNSVRD